MSYQLKLHKSVINFLENAPNKLRFRIISKLDLLKENPLHHALLDIKSMQGFDQTYRLRIGNYRLIYQINQDQLRLVSVSVAMCTSKDKRF